MAFSTATLPNFRPLSRNMKRIALAMILMGFASFQTGCTNLNTLRANPSPGLLSRSMTPDQELNNFALMVNRDYRSAVDDFKRTFLLSRPSRMNPAPNPW